MGQVLRAMTYDRSTEDSIQALEWNGTPLLWSHLDDGIMGGKSETDLAVDDDSSLHFQGTIDTHASVGWASARASLPQVAPNTTALQLNVCGDGKTYKVLLHDDNHESGGSNKTPLWEADLSTNGEWQQVTIPLISFIPSFMGTPLNASEKAKHLPLNPSSLTRIGFMLSSRLSDGTINPVETYGKGTFHFSLLVKSISAVTNVKPEQAPKL